MTYKSLTLLLTCYIFLIPACLAQLGTQINAPASNSTVKPGDNVEIGFSYENMGTGTYSVDIDVWTDNTLKTLSTNIANDYSVSPGNSTGTQLKFNLNSTYSWQVPHGLNETIYLTVTTNVKLTTNASYTMRSRGIILHVNAGIVNLPTHALGLLALSIVVFSFTGVF